MELITEIISSFWFQTIFKLVLVFFLAGIIGLERDSWNKPAGFRTHSLVGISAVLVRICGEYMSQKHNVDPTRISAQLLSGIGFIGAGTILRDGFNVKGLTTAAGLLAVTCIGLSIGAGYYFGGIVATAIVYIILSYSHKISGKLEHFDLIGFRITVENEQAIKQIEETLNKYEVDIKQIKRLDEEDNDKNIKIIVEYNRKIFNKNQLISDMSLIEGVEDIIVE